MVCQNQEKWQEVDTYMQSVAFCMSTLLEDVSVGCVKVSVDPFILSPLLLLIYPMVWLTVGAPL